MLEKKMRIVLASELKRLAVVDAKAARVFAENQTWLMMKLKITEGYSAKLILAALTDAIGYTTYEALLGVPDLPNCREDVLWLVRGFAKDLCREKGLLDGKGGAL